MYDNDESVTDHICLTQKQKKEREEPSKKDIYNECILAAWRGPFRVSGVVPPPFSLSRRGTGEREREEGEERERRGLTRGRRGTSCCFVFSHVKFAVSSR